MVFEILVAGTLAGSAIIFGGPILVVVAFSPDCKHIRQRVVYRLGFGRAKYKLKAQVKFILTAVVTGQVNPADITYDSMHSILEATKSAFPQISHEYFMRTSLKYPQRIPVDRLWCLSQVLEKAQARKELPPVFFVKKTFSLLLDFIAVSELYPSEGPKNLAGHKIWEQALDLNVSSIFEFFQRGGKAALTELKAQPKHQAFLLKVRKKV